MARTILKPQGFPGAEEYIPDRPSLKNMRAAVDLCRGCDLYKNATQGVFGEGSAGADCVLIGEQPGNDEDLQGRPFVGPAGKILDQALDEVGIDRDRVYITNAVKHFKNEIRGNRRLHRSPAASEIGACKPWLERELRIVKPRVIVCLGLSAAQSVLGKKITLRDVRGKFIVTDYSEKTIVTTHPSAILRAPDPASKKKSYEDFVKDLKVAAKALS
jgi:uracil-DNA glycosylase